MTILIVEDDTEMRRLIRSLVAPVADHIHECGNGADAVIFYARLRPDWVLMDLKLPILDGIDATKAIRAQFPAARIIMVSNYEDEGLKRAAGLAGVCAYVSKRDLLVLSSLLK